MNTPTEFTYEDLAEIFGVSGRQVRILVKRYGSWITPIRYSHKKVRFASAEVWALKKHLRELAVKAMRKGGAR